MRFQLQIWWLGARGPSSWAQLVGPVRGPSLKSPFTGERPIPLDAVTVIVVFFIVVGYASSGLAPASRLVPPTRPIPVDAVTALVVFSLLSVKPVVVWHVLLSSSHPRDLFHLMLSLR